MSMLAGPRRKQKVINLRAKNNAWSNDNNKFGQRMLEKMGWSAGKGLGANENGIVEHVVARYKNDEKGLGFEDKNDQWTKHEDDFNALLANLSNDDASVEKLHSGISLEDKSKKSKARVHYHKFTRGKDLTRYSEKDLANIFGKKTFKSEAKNDHKIVAEEVKDSKESEQVFTEKGSMEDYFKSKLAAFKSKNTYTFNNNINKDDDDNAEYVFKGFSTNCDETDESSTTNGFGYQPFSDHSSKTEDKSKSNTQETNEESCDNEIGSKKKKKKKSKEIKPNHCEVDNTPDNKQIEKENCDNLEVSKKKKKKKKSKQSDVDVDINTDEQNNCSESKNVENIQEEIESTKKRKKSREDSIEVAPEENVCKKKKKNKTKLEPQETVNILENVVDIESYAPKKKKKKKNKCDENQ